MPDVHLCPKGEPRHAQSQTLPIKAQAALMSAAKTAGGADDRAGQICEVNFFVGVEHTVRNEPAEARPLLQLAASTCPHDYITNRATNGAAVAELKRLDALAPEAKQ